jgi:hypothetical protein
MIRNLRKLNVPVKNSVLQVFSETPLIFNVDVDALDKSTDNFGVILVTSYYKSSNQQRNYELNECIRRNSLNKYIKKIYLLNDQEYDMSFLPFQEKIIQVILEEGSDRLTFEYAITFTNTYLKDEICIIANTDIYYDNTLVLLNNYNFEKKVMALSRYEHSTQKLNNCPISCHDAWIYKSPVSIDIKKCNFNFGTYACDHVINFLFSERNFIFGPCYSIRSYHLHDSNYRTYDPNNKVIGNYHFVEPTFLDLKHVVLQEINKFIDEDGICIMTFINEGYFQFLYNYIINLKKRNITWKLLVICIDNGSSSLCKKYGIDHILYRIGENNQLARFGTNQFRKTTMLKLDCISFVLENKNVKRLVYTDTDIAVYKDYMPYLKSLDTTIDIYFQNDNNSPYPTIIDGNNCTGIILMNNNETIQKLWLNTPLNEKIYKIDDSDQSYINSKLQTMNIVVGKLPRKLFPNGIFFNNSIVFPEAYILHYNYMIGTEKIQSMKRNNDWYL